MLNIISNLGTSFVLGLLTPTTAVCVLPLFPAFLGYLANQLERVENPKKTLLLFGLLITAGVVSFMTLLGVIFTTILEVSLTNVIGIISPIAFGLLTVISVMLIFNFDLGRFLPKMKTPRSKNPYFGAFSYGFFFGAIVVPCNPLFIATLFTRTLSSSDMAINIFNFLFFGLGVGFPLVLFSLMSSVNSRAVIGFLTRHKKIINRLAGIAMLIISLYYLTFVFKVQNILLG